MSVTRDTCTQEYRWEKYSTHVLDAIRIAKKHRDKAYHFARQIAKCLHLLLLADTTEKTLIFGFSDVEKNK